MPSPNFDRRDESIRQCADLFFTGAGILDVMLRNRSVPDGGFQEWAKLLRSSSGLKSELTAHSSLVWLWEALRKAPALNDFFGNLPRAAPWSNEHKRFEVFPAGECFVIGMNRAEVTKLLRDVHRAPHEERVFLKTAEPLQMRPGSGGRLECYDCRLEVTIRVDEEFAPTREADILRIDEGMIETAKGLVTAQVKSLNQAYTVASRRLEPKRRSHGGRVYDHVVHVGENSRMQLDEIRQLVESDRWETPEQPGDSPPASGTRSLFDQSEPVT